MVKGAAHRVVEDITVRVTQLCSFPRVTDTLWTLLSRLRTSVWEYDSFAKPTGGSWERPWTQSLVHGDIPGTVGMNAVVLMQVQDPPPSPRVTLRPHGRRVLQSYHGGTEKNPENRLVSTP